MSEEGTVLRSRMSTPVLAGAGFSLLLALCALIWCFGLNNHLSMAEKQLAAAQAQSAELARKQDALSARLSATAETLGRSVGLTQKQIDAKTQNILAAQAAQMQVVKSTTLQTARLAEQEEASAKQIGAVASDVSSVKTDVSGAKTSIADTQSDLASTKAQLQRTMGDQGVMSGLIARTHDELETLKHRGDRNYYEFTLQKGAKPTLLSTVKLQAKKVDDKRSKYTMMVSADDRNIEKKDKSLDEPVQFYTGKDPVLYEIVVNVIAKNQISGYLSTPKGAVQPISAPPSN